MNGEDLEVAAGGSVDDDVGKPTRLVAVRRAPRNRSSTRSSYQCCASTIPLWPGGGAERFDSPDAARLSDLVHDVVPRVRHKFARVDLIDPLSGLVSPHAFELIAIALEWPIVEAVEQIENQLCPLGLRQGEHLGAHRIDLRVHAATLERHTYVG
jgi:hypothetical protein